VHALAAGELVIAVGPWGGREDLIAKALKLPGTRVLKDSVLFDVL
jgi:hypothetical protein